MAKYLSQEWLDLQTKLANDSQPERPNATAKIQYVVKEGPEGDILYYWTLERGRIVENKVGELPDAEVTLTTSYDDAVKIQKGELNTNVAFMQGRVKVSGSMGKIMSLLPITNSPEYKKLQQDLTENTEF